MEISIADQAKAMFDLSCKFADTGMRSDLHRGHLPKLTSRTAFERLIELGCVTAEWDEHSLVGYYAVDHWRLTYSPDQFLHLENFFLDACRKRGTNPTRGACGAQCVIDIPYQGTGLRTRLLTRISAQLGDRFDFFFSNISRENHRAMRGHSKDGWEHVAEDEDRVYVIYDLRV